MRVPLLSPDIGLLWAQKEAKELGVTITLEELEELPYPRTAGSISEYLIQKAERARVIPESQKLILSPRQYKWFASRGYDMRYFVESQNLPMMDEGDEG